MSEFVFLFGSSESEHVTHMGTPERERPGTGHAGQIQLIKRLQES